MASAHASRRAATGSNVWEDAVSRTADEPGKEETPPMERYQERILEKGHLLLFGEIDEDMIRQLIEQLLYLTSGKKRPVPVTMWINSTGGLLQPTFALADFVSRLKVPIHTVGMGTVESAAALILMSGSKGKRALMRNCSLMIHEYSWSNSGSFTEMSSRMKEVQNTIKKQLAFMSRHSGKTAEELKAIVRHEETWLTPEEAVKWGIIDKVL
ncbi:MAG: ATP-dependent Clp protease proteolytic subunit [Candidatus Wallbacteria bacterium]|nr:ATP-dependent Clp protease proteolytic subunit [Candidatus Wallbacteria bacterium]